MDTSRSYLSLDGDWKLVLDPKDVGIKEAWFKKADYPEPLTVQVPSVWDLWVPDYDGVGWYFKEFAADAAWAGQHVELQFDAADYYAEVWLNGVRLGDHEGGYTPFSFNVAAHLQTEKKNLLAVRIVDPHGPEGYGEFHPKELPVAKEEGYWSFAGLWGSVRLEVKPRAHVEDVFVQPDIRRKRITVTVETSAPGTVHLHIDGTPYRTEGEAGVFALDFPDFELWSPESPKLYTLQVDLIQEDGSFDRTSVRFGMREFSVKDNRFYLNNRPIHLKGILHQPDYARTLAAPENEALARREIELAKKAGFNMIRLHIKTPPKITLELGDELGMLFYQEPPIGWIKDSAHMRERCEREVREMVLRDRNHPSIVIWGMLNESGNADYVTHGGAQNIKDDLCKLTRSLDPTRLIIDDSAGVNATRERSRYLRPYRDSFEVFDDLHIYQRAPVDFTMENYYRHNGQPKQLCTVSEFGFGGMENLPDVLEQYGEDQTRLKDARFLKKILDATMKGFSERNLERVFGDFSGFAAAAQALQCDAARFQIDAMRANPKLAGYCYTQLADAGHEFCAGALDRWRRPKPVLKALKEAQAPVRPLIQMAQTNLFPRQEANVTVLLANEARLEGRADLSLQVVGPTNQVLWKKKRSVKIPRHGKELWTGAISASGSIGTHKFVVRLMQGMKKIAESSVELYVVAQPEPCDVAINVLDSRDGEWSSKCSPFAKTGNLIAPIHVVPPLGNTIRAYPDNDLMQVMAQVKGGAVAIFFSPPKDWSDLAERIDENLKATTKNAVGCFLPVCHYAKLHPVFEKLPARGLMRQPYRNVAPAFSFLESSDEDICGCYDAMPAAGENYMMDGGAWWGSNILVKRYGSGRIVLTHLRVLEHLGNDPLADRLFINMLNHFARRSVPSDSPLPVDQKSVEWLRGERNNNVRKWMVLGEFPNWNDEGHQAVYPPETNIDLEGTYPGWYQAINWRPWFSALRDGHEVNLQDALSPIFEYYPRFDHATSYAYAEFSCERRQSVRMNIGIQNAMKIWLNGTLIFECEEQVPHDEFESDFVNTSVKQGRNTLLVKCTKIPGPYRFSIDFRCMDQEILQMNWWR